MSKDYSEFLGPKHNSVLAKQKVFWPKKSVLPKHFLFCQNTFCVYLLGLFIRFGEKLFQGYIQHTEKLSRNRRLEENMESRPFFWCALSIAPPSPPNPVSSWSHHQSMWHTIHTPSTCAQAPMTANAVQSTWQCQLLVRC